ncbi:hypothetical protein CXB51_008036 [Gossypium anomalum]|uniref:Uncharacterized protein n=1 Tax=Gossypium anomalum TaxID=47600 RepID=A0A8J6D7S5_9ROSI|nr:hypothetical protein CXB51_008036 [Gossypium anomalum]
MEKKKKKRRGGEEDEKMEGALYQRFPRNGLDTKVEKSRKQMKEKKNRDKKVRGVKKMKVGEVAKKK